MTNIVALTGRLTKDVDLRYTQKGVAVGAFTLAVDRNFTNSNGERDADFIRCIIWKKQAENLANFVKKGSLVSIDGHIQTRSYENQQGQRVFMTEVIVEHFTLTESKKDKESRGNGPSSPMPNNVDQNNRQPDINSPFGDANAGPIDISDDDLPF